MCLTQIDDRGWGPAGACHCCSSSPLQRALLRSPTIPFNLRKRGPGSRDARIFSDDIDHERRGGVDEAGAAGRRASTGAFEFCMNLPYLLVDDPVRDPEMDARRGARWAQRKTCTYFVFFC